MPQLDPSVFPTQLFWLLLTFIPLYLIMWKVALPRVASTLETRRDRIDSDLQKAAALKAEAEAALADYEKTMTEAADKAQATIREAGQQIADEAAKRREELAAKLDAQVAEAEQRIAGEKASAIESVNAMAVELVQAASSRLVDTDISEDEAKAAISAVTQGVN